MNPRLCTISGCTEPHVGNGLCRKHYSESPQVRKRENARRRGNPRQAELRKKYNQSRKYDVMHHYSNGTMRCSCCNEEHIEFLTINHINGGGGKHVKQLRKDGTDLYPFLKASNYPEGYNVLCLNCNFAEGHFEMCPHKNLKENGGLEQVGIFEPIEKFEQIEENTQVIKFDLDKINGVFR